MESNEEYLERIRKEREKLLGHKAYYRDLQGNLNYIDAGLQQLDWAERVLKSPCGTESSIRSEAMNGLQGWSGIASAPDFNSMGWTGAYGIGTSATSGVADKMHHWRVERGQYSGEVYQLEQEHIAASNNSEKLSRLETYLRYRAQNLGDDFSTSMKLYAAWKANPADSRAFFLSMRNVMENLKGQLNVIAADKRSIKVRDEVSWNKIFDSIGVKNNVRLVAEKSKYERLHSDLSEYLKGIKNPEQATIEQTYSIYLDNIDSLVHLLDSDVKTKYFGFSAS